MAVNICTAVKQGDGEMLRKLLEAGADPQTYCTKEGFVEERKSRSSGSKSLLYLAVENENLQVLKILLKNLDNSSLQRCLSGGQWYLSGGQFTNYTPTNIAVLRSNEKIVHQIIERLTEEPAVDNLAAKRRVFAVLEENIRLAIKSKQYKMFDYLIGELTKKVDIQYSSPLYKVFDQNNNGYTILSELGPEEKYFKDRLLEIGVEPTDKDIQKEATEGNLELVEKLKSRQEECKLLREERFKKEREEAERQIKKNERERKLLQLIEDFLGYNTGCTIVIGILILLALFL
jgi:hypothetical protein